MLCGISPSFPGLSPTSRADYPRVTHPSAALLGVLLPRLARLACVRHAASVHSEPGSNSPVLTVSSCEQIEFEALTSALRLMVLPLFETFESSPGSSFDVPKRNDVPVFTYSVFKEPTSSQRAAILPTLSLDVKRNVSSPCIQSSTLWGRKNFAWNRTAVSRCCRGGACSGKTVLPCPTGRRRLPSAPRLVNPFRAASPPRSQRFNITDFQLTFCGRRRPLRYASAPLEAASRDRFQPRVSLRYFRFSQSRDCSRSQALPAAFRRSSARCRTQRNGTSRRFISGARISRSAHHFRCPDRDSYCVSRTTSRSGTRHNLGG